MEYNAKVISAETIARVLDGEAAGQTNATTETTEPEKKSARKKPTAKKTSSKKTTRKKSETKTTDKPAPKKTGGRKKKSDNPDETGESQVSRL